VADQLVEKRIGGVGPLVNNLEWDVKVYLALNGAVHDAAIGAWSTKHYYDSSRPISLIRYMGGLGQSSDPGGPSYHPDGLPLVPDLIEVITAATTGPGGKHEHLKESHKCDSLSATPEKPCVVDADCEDALTPGVASCATIDNLGKIAIYAWNGPPAVPATQVSGSGWILAGNWMPYFPKSFVTPPFPGFTSGHSTFSRSGAEVMTAITGDPFVPGGIDEFVAEVNEYLEVDEGPTQTLHLQWATYYDAADQAGISRRFGGIHPFYDDYPARIMGSQIGQKAWARALELYNTPTDDGGGDDEGGDDEAGDDDDDEDGDGGDHESATDVDAEGEGAAGGGLSSFKAEILDEEEASQQPSGDSTAEPQPDGASHGGRQPADRPAPPARRGRLTESR
jgi:hypothetical protein